MWSSVSSPWRFKKIKAQQDQQAQYSRRNCHLFHGIREEKGEDTKALSLIW